MVNGPWWRQCIEFDRNNYPKYICRMTLKIRLGQVTIDRCSVRKWREAQARKDLSCFCSQTISDQDQWLPADVTQQGDTRDSRTRIVKARAIRYHSTKDVVSKMEKDTTWRWLLPLPLFLTNIRALNRKWQIDRLLHVLSFSFAFTYG